MKFRNPRSVPARKSLCALALPARRDPARRPGGGEGERAVKHRLTLMIGWWGEASEISRVKLKFHRLYLKFSINK